jgi:hypothetical protein
MRRLVRSALLALALVPALAGLASAGELDRIALPVLKNPFATSATQARAVDQLPFPVLKNPFAAAPLLLKDPFVPVLKNPFRH